MPSHPVGVRPCTCSEKRTMQSVVDQSRLEPPCAREVDNRSGEIFLHASGLRNIHFRATIMCTESNSTPRVGPSLVHLFSLEPRSLAQWFVCRYIEGGLPQPFRCRLLRERFQTSCPVSPLCRSAAVRSSQRPPVTSSNEALWSVCCFFSRLRRYVQVVSAL